MSLISLQNACFDYGREKILDHVNLNIFAGVRYALVGANGAGKTTLLSLLTGEIALQKGERQVAGSLRIGTLHQETTLDDRWLQGASLRDGVARVAFAEELALEQELARIARALTRAHGQEQANLIRLQGHQQTEYERRGGYALRARLDETLTGLGLSTETWSRPLHQLSGGERRRGALAAILLSGGDVLLLDEPTNHLDLEGCEWLEDFLVRHSGAVVLVSHDRQFLDRVAGQTWHLESGKLTSYSGNYTFFAAAYRRQRERQELLYDRQQEHIRRAEDYIQRNIAGQKTRQAQSRRRQLDKLERLEKPSGEPGEFRFQFQPLRPSGQMILTAEGLTKGYGDKVLIDAFDLMIARGERLGIIGPNGSGKTTLLKLLAGREQPDSGSIKWGHNVDAGLYDQHLQIVSDENTVLEEMAVTNPAATHGQLRGMLGAFGFGDDLIDRPVSRLSGGERGRLALLKIIQQGHNTLFLDEPTNHLDYRRREALEAALAAYEGTLVVVSHDRRFLDRLVQRLIVFTPGLRAGRVQAFLGNYEEYHRRRLPGGREATAAAARAAGTASAVGGRPGTPPPESLRPPQDGPILLSKNEQERRRRWIADVETDIAQLESEKDSLLAGMSSPDLTAEARREMGQRCARIESELAQKVAQWETWNLEIERGIQGG
jgi:ATP-binding cassette subfamily F protein 3